MSTDGQEPDHHRNTADAVAEQSQTDDQSETDDEVTRLSQRGMAEESDVTRVSRRAPAGELDETRVSRRAPAGEADVTRLSARRAGSSTDISDEPTQAATPRGRDRGPAPLPPGRVTRPRTAAGTFGTSEPASHPRPVPPMPTTGAVRDEGEVTAASAVLADAVLTPEQAAQRREAERRKRLTMVLIVSCVAAAAITGAVLGVIALVAGG